MTDPGLIIAPIFFLSLFGMIFGIVYMRNKENMALIDRGINPRTGRKSLPRSFFSLKIGLLLAGAGLGLMLALFADQHLINHKVMDYDGHPYYRDYPQIYLALIGMCGGLGLVISYIIERKEWDKRAHEGADDIPVLPGNWPGHADATKEDK